MATTNKRKKPYTGMAAFPEPGGEAAHEFQRIIAAGPNAMTQFPRRILPPILETIAAEGIGDIAHGWSFQYVFVRDLLVEGAQERYGEAEEEMLGWHVNLLKLRDLLLAIQSGLEMSNLKRRVQVFQRLLDLFWTVFLVPMLRADGVSKAQGDRTRGKGKADKRLQAARRMRDNGSSRSEIVNYLATTFPVTKQQARKDCDRIGFSSQPKKEKKRK